MEAGVAVVRITPPLGVSMGGYGHRTHGAEGVADDLMLKVLAFAAGGVRGALVTADLLWLRREAVDAVKAALRARWGLAPEHVLVACSHTHSGPQTSSDSPGIGSADPGYLRGVTAALVEAVGRALSDLQPVQLRAARGRGGLGVHRRVLVDGRARMLPHPAGPRDDEVLAVEAAAPEGRRVAVLFQYACHPTCLGGYDISADWPGAAMRRVEADLGCPCLFVQGCCGDVRPNFTDAAGARFRPATVPETHAAGEAIGAEVVRALRTGAAPLPGTGGGAGVGGEIVELGLEYARVPDVAELRAAAEGGEASSTQGRAGAAWARFLLGRPERLAPALPFRIHRLDLGAGLALVGMEGEICVGYGFAAKALAGGRVVVPVGYADGCLAYIPTADMFPEGGYEVAEAYPYFGLAAPFTEAIDPAIRAALARLLEAEGATAGDTAGARA